MIIKTKTAWLFFYTNVSYKKMGMDDIKYPMIGLISQKEICKVCSVEFKFLDKKEKFTITNTKDGAYKINNTLKFNKLFKEAKTVEFTITKLGNYKFNYDDLKFDMPEGNWITLNHEDKDLDLKMKIHNLESTDSSGSISFAKSDTLKIFTISTYDQTKCSKDCKINISFDNVKKVYSVFNYDEGLILSSENNKEFEELLNKSNTIKVSIVGIKNAKVHVFDNTIKDYQ